MSRPMAVLLRGLPICDWRLPPGLKTSRHISNNTPPLPEDCVPGSGSNNGGPALPNRWRIAGDRWGIRFREVLKAVAVDPGEVAVDPPEEVVPQRLAKPTQKS